MRFLVLENVETGRAMYEARPALDVRWGSQEVRRFRSAAPRILANVLRQVRKADVVVSGSEVGFGLLLGWRRRGPRAQAVRVLVQSSLPRAVAAWTRPACGRC